MRQLGGSDGAAEGVWEGLDEAAEALASFICEHRPAVLTGAGCSTESGIPDYRGPDAPVRRRSPITGPEFMASEKVRRRFWLRSTVGWPKFASASPNAAHLGIRRLQAADAIAGLITQNVDGLHRVAGSRDAVELHGSIWRVRCMVCEARYDREALQEVLLARNPGLVGRAATLLPDGDAAIEDARAETFVVPDCVGCGGLLKPDVVFFGENVPRPVVNRAFEVFAEGRGLLVVGSSLTVFSGYRFVREAVKQGRPVAMLNLTEARGEADAVLRVRARAAEVFPRVLAQLSLVGAAPNAPHA